LAVGFLPAPLLLLLPVVVVVVVRGLELLLRLMVFAWLFSGALGRLDLVS
jgi:hypothetical protein